MNVETLFRIYHSSFEPSERGEVQKRKTRAEFAILFGDIEASSLRPFALEEWFLRHPDWNPNTKKTNGASIKTPFNWAVREGLLEYNPIASVTFGKTPTVEPMTDNEYKKLYEAADTRAKTKHFQRVLQFMYMTGCRPGELSIIRWRNVHLDLGIIVLERKTRRKREVASKKELRYIYLPPEVVSFLKTIPKGKKDSYVFTNRAGKPWTRCSLSLRMQRLRHKAGVRKGCRLFGQRYAYAIKALKNDVSEEKVAKLQGYKNTEQLRKLPHPVSKDLLCAAKKAVSTKGQTQ